MKVKRILLISAILLLCLALLCGCQRKPKMTIGDLSTRDVRNDTGITLTAAEATTATGGKFTLYNGGESYCYYGDIYLVEVLMEDGWHGLEAEIVSTLLLNDLSAGDSYVREYKWYAHYGELPAGTYRILQEVLPPDFAENQESYFVSYEFTIG